MNRMQDQPIDPKALPAHAGDTTTFMMPDDFPVTVRAEMIGLVLTARSGESSFNVIISWNQIERAREKAENPFAGMTGEQALEYIKENPIQ